MILRGIISIFIFLTLSSCNEKKVIIQDKDPYIDSLNKSLNIIYDYVYDEHLEDISFKDGYRNLRMNEHYINAGDGISVHSEVECPKCRKLLKDLIKEAVREELETQKKEENKN